LLETPDPALRIRYYHQDHLSSSGEITDATSALVEESALYAFGVPRNEYRLRQVEAHYQFTQKERDRESRLHYFEARFMTGELARFLIADPKYANPEILPSTDLASFLSNPQTGNLYAYCLNNPLRYTDPTGLGPWRWFRDNVYIPFVDPVSELDVGRTVKVAGGIALAASTGGGSLIVQGAVLVVASDQIVSGVTGNESYVHKGGKALFSGNETAGTVVEAAVTLGAGGYNTVTRLSSASRLTTGGVVTADAAAGAGILRSSAARTFGGQVKGGGGVLARTATPSELASTGVPVPRGAATAASQSGDVCRAASAAEEEMLAYIDIFQQQRAILQSGGMQSGSGLVNAAFENADQIWISTRGTVPPGLRPLK
jgi:RHS repeat-associated protein